MANPECLAEVERSWVEGSSRATSPPAPINPSDDWWQQWFADNGVPADDGVFRRPGCGSTARPTRATRPWPGRGSHC